MVDTHHLLWFALVMSSLKSFLYGVAPILGMSGAALYERQRALVALGALQSLPGRGPGSGVPFTVENFAAILIAVLASDNLSEVDNRVTALLKAEHDESFDGRSFLSDVSSVLTSGADYHLQTEKIRAIRVSRCWRGQIVRGVGLQSTASFTVGFGAPSTPINITAEIEDEELWQLITFVQGALSQTETDGDDE